LAGGNIFLHGNGKRHAKRFQGFDHCKMNLDFGRWQYACAGDLRANLPGHISGTRRRSFQVAAECFPATPIVQIVANKVARDIFRAMRKILTLTPD